MVFFRNLIKEEKKSIFNLFLVFCLTLLIGLGCGGGGGGGGDDDDDDVTPTNPLIGVWQVKTVTETCDSEDPQVTELPMTLTGVATGAAFVKLSATEKLYYAKLTDVTQGISIPGVGTISDGVYYCSTEEETYSISGNTITEEDKTTRTYSLSGTTLTFVNDGDEGCTVTTVLEKADDSTLTGATENCALFALFTNTISQLGL